MTASEIARGESSENETSQQALSALPADSVRAAPTSGGGWKSAVLGTVDVAYNFYGWASYPRAHRWFSDGYGDMPEQVAEADATMAEWKKDAWASMLSVPLQVAWSSVETGDEAVWADECSFNSPLVGLPDLTRTARALFVRAAPGGALPPTRAVTLIMAPTGDDAYADRDAKLARPLLQHGIASLIMMAPFYGTRAPAGQTKHFIANVADYMRQSLAIILEGAALLRWAARGFEVRAGEPRYEDLRLGVAGLSWGGAMASCAAVVSRLPVACMTGLGSDSPRVMATGAINWQLNWDALMRARGHSREEASAEIQAIFTRVTLASLVADSSSPSVGAVIQVSARDDHYVYASEGTQLHDSLVKAVIPGGKCELQWVDGGHGTAFVKQTQYFVPAIVEAIDALGSGCAQ